MQMQPLLQPTMHQTQIMAPPKVSIGGGNGGPPYELLVENLPNSVSIDELVAKFSSFGTVNGASLRQAVGRALVGLLTPKSALLTPRASRPP